MRSTTEHSRGGFGKPLTLRSSRTPRSFQPQRCTLQPVHDAAMFADSHGRALREHAARCSSFLDGLRDANRPCPRFVDEPSILRRHVLISRLARGRERTVRKASTGRARAGHEATMGRPRPWEGSNGLWLVRKIALFARQCARAARPACCDRTRGCGGRSGTARKLGA